MASSGTGFLISSAEDRAPWRSASEYDFLDVFYQPLKNAFEYDAKREVKLSVLKTQLEKLIKNNLDDNVKKDITESFYHFKKECLALFKTLIETYQVHHEIEKINSAIRWLLIAYQGVIHYELSKGADDKTKQAKLAACNYLLSNDVDLTSLKNFQQALKNKAHQKVLSQGRLGKIVELIKKTLLPLSYSFQGQMSSEDRLALFKIVINNSSSKAIVPDLQKAFENNYFEQCFAILKQNVSSNLSSDPLFVKKIIPLFLKAYYRQYWKQFIDDLDPIKSKSYYKAAAVLFLINWLNTPEENRGDIVLHKEFHNHQYYLSKDILRDFLKLIQISFPQTAYQLPTLRDVSWALNPEGKRQIQLLRENLTESEDHKKLGVILNNLSNQTSNLQRMGNLLAEDFKLLKTHLLTKDNGFIQNLLMAYEYSHNPGQIWLYRLEGYFLPYSALTAEQLSQYSDPFYLAMTYSQDQSIKQQMFNQVMESGKSIELAPFLKDGECFKLSLTMLEHLVLDDEGKVHKKARDFFTIFVDAYIHRIIDEFDNRDTAALQLSGHSKQSKQNASSFLQSVLKNNSIDLSNIAQQDILKPHLAVLNEGRLGEIFKLIQKIFPKQEVRQKESIQPDVDALPPLVNISFDQIVDKLNQLKLSILFNEVAKKEIDVAIEQWERSQDTNKINASFLLRNLRENERLAPKNVIFFGKNAAITSGFFLSLEGFPFLKTFFGLLDGVDQSDQALQDYFVSYGSLTAEQIIKNYEHPLTFAIENKLSDTVRTEIFKIFIERLYQKREKDLKKAFEKGYFELCFKILRATVNFCGLPNSTMLAKKPIQLFLSVYFETYSKEQTSEYRAVEFLINALQDPQQEWGDIVLRAGFSDHKKSLMEGKLGQIFKLIQDTFPRTTYALPILKCSTSWTLNAKAIEEIHRLKEFLNLLRDDQQAKRSLIEVLDELISRQDDIQKGKSLTTDQFEFLKTHLLVKDNGFIQTLVMVYEHDYKPEKIRLRTLEDYFLPYSALTAEQLSQYSDPFYLAMTYSQDQSIKQQMFNQVMESGKSIELAPFLKDGECFKLSLTMLEHLVLDDEGKVHEKARDFFTIFVDAYIHRINNEFDNRDTAALQLSGHSKQSKQNASSFLQSVLKNNSIDLSNIAQQDILKPHLAVLNEGRLGEIFKLIQKIFPKQEVRQEESIKPGVDTLPSRSGLFAVYGTEGLARTLTLREKQEMINRMQNL